MPALWPAALRASIAFHRVVERLGRCHADVVEPCRDAHGTQLIDIVQTEHWVAEHWVIVARRRATDDAGWSASALFASRALLVSQALLMAQSGCEADVAQKPQCSDLGRVDDDRLVGLA